MNSIQRFFRKYFLSTMGLLLLFLSINILLALTVLIVSYKSSSAPELPVARLAEGITERNGIICSDPQVKKILTENRCWAMLLDDSGTVVWEEGMPKSLPRSYTASEIAKFSRWYLQEYPVYVWEHPLGLFVTAYPKGSMQKYNFSMDSSYLSSGLLGIFMILSANLLFMLLLFWKNTHNVEKAIRPILTGISAMAKGKTVSLEEKGELAEISVEVNRTAKMLQSKDASRAQWISGVSHDIRTPLSVILGYAGSMEDDSSLSSDIRDQAAIIRMQGEKLRQLISDLNLASRLEYAMQPLKKTFINPVELVRQCISDFFNNGLDPKYGLELDIRNAADSPPIEGDHSLLTRMLDNLIGNSIRHNPEGCQILVSVTAEKENCRITVADTGRGADAALLKKLNHMESIAITQNDKGEIIHGNGLKLVKQIVKAHGGKIYFSQNLPQGMTVTVELPLYIPAILE